MPGWETPYDLLWSISKLKTKSSTFGVKLKIALVFFHTKHEALQFHVKHKPVETHISKVVA